MLQVRNLSVSFPLDGNGQMLYAVCGVDLDVYSAETMIVIGESGSGKSVMGLALISLLPEMALISGKVIFQEKDLLALNARALRRMRGELVGFVPQSAGQALNPTMIARKQIEEIFLEKKAMKKRSAKRVVESVLKKLGINPYEANRYPHQLSGGMRQRILLGMGLASAPQLLIADEPTKGIDYERKEEITTLLRGIRGSNPDMSMLIITHDLNLAEDMGHRIAVMYAGQILEIAEANSFFHEPLHPYSRGLLDSMPERGLKPIAGQAPLMAAPALGCPFCERCDKSLPQCFRQPPKWVEKKQSTVKCWRYVNA